MAKINLNMNQSRVRLAHCVWEFMPKKDNPCTLVYVVNYIKENKDSIENDFSKKAEQDVLKIIAEDVVKQKNRETANRENRIANNILIAEFMGGYNNVITNNMKIDVFGNGAGIYWYEQLKYHVSWEWLMPVAQKVWEMVNHTHKEYGDIKHSENFGTNREMIPHLVLYCSTEQASWQMVDFIKWYNENNK